MPLSVDVIIPAYNAAATLAATLESVLSQRRPPTRVIVVDDGSPDDGTAQVAGRFSPRVTLLRQANGGEGSARAFGATHSSADVLMFLDADDVLLPDAIESLTALLDADPHAVAAYGRAELWAGDRPPTLRADPLTSHQGDVWRHLLRRNFVRTPGCAVVRADAFRRCGGWDTHRSLKGHADWDFWLRLARHGPFAATDRSVLWYRVHGGSLSGNYAQMEWSARRVARKHRRLYDDPADRVLVARTMHFGRTRPWQEWSRLAGLALRRWRWRLAGRLAGESVRIYARGVKQSLTRRLRRST